jgi:hypothetical protein
MEKHTSLSPSSATTLHSLVCLQLTAFSATTCFQLPHFYIRLLNIFRSQLTLTSSSQDVYYYLQVTSLYKPFPLKARRKVMLQLKI